VQGDDDCVESVKSLAASWYGERKGGKIEAYSFSSSKLSSSKQLALKTQIPIKMIDHDKKKRCTFPLINTTTTIIIILIFFKEDDACCTEIIDGMGRDDKNVTGR